MNLPFKDDYYPTITSPFGWRKIPFPSYHNGVDWGCPVGTPLYAVDDGSVVHAVDQYGGLFAQLNTDNGYWHYVHLDKFGKAGSVKKGDLIGYSGNTGKSTGAHLHLGFNYKGKWVDPIPFLNLINSNFTKKEMKELKDYLSNLINDRFDRLEDQLRDKYSLNAYMYTRTTDGLRWEGGYYDNVGFQDWIIVGTESEKTARFTITINGIRYGENNERFDGSNFYTVSDNAVRSIRFEKGSGFVVVESDGVPIVVSQRTLSR